MIIIVNLRGKFVKKLQIKKDMNLNKFIPLSIFFRSVPKANGKTNDKRTADFGCRKDFSRLTLYADTAKVKKFLEKKNDYKFYLIVIK